MCKFWAACHLCLYRLHCGSAGQSTPERSTRTLPNSLQDTVRGLYHQSPDVTVKPQRPYLIVSPLPPPLCLPPPSAWMVPSIMIWQSVHRFDSFPQVSDDRSFCTCSDAWFIWLFEWQNNWQTAHRKQRAIWCEQRCHIKPSSHLFFDTEVPQFGLRRISPGNWHFVQSR